MQVYCVVSTPFIVHLYGTVNCLVITSHAGVYCVVSSTFMFQLCGTVNCLVIRTHAGLPCDIYYLHCPFLWDCELSSSLDPSRIVLCNWLWLCKLKPSWSNYVGLWTVLVTLSLAEVYCVLSTTFIVHLYGTVNCLVITTHYRCVLCGIYYLQCPFLWDSELSSSLDPSRKVLCDICNLHCPFCGTVNCLAASTQAGLYFV